MGRIISMSEVKITINNDRRLVTSTGGSLYVTLNNAGVFVPSLCGGRGGCGLCRLKVLNGAGDQLLTGPEKHWLSGKEISDGVRLSCQVKVLNDLEIAVPDQLLQVREYQAQVLSIRNLTHDIKEVRLKLLKPEEMPFKPGQYIQVKIPPYELSKRPVFRTYSMAGDPAHAGELELEVKFVPNGISTTYIHKHLKEGDVLTINGPHGNAFPVGGAGNVILVAGGSGMSPVKSVLFDMAARHDTRKVRYFFGAKARRDLFLLDLMGEFERKLGDFRFIPALSEPAVTDNWAGEKGLITDVIERNLSDVADTIAYLCGSPPMIDACVKVLSGKGLPGKNIHYDKFI